MARLKTFSLNHPKIRHILVGLLITAVLVGAKLIFERLAIGHRVELLTFELLQGRLTAIDHDPLPVVVLDISSVPGGTAEQPTSRSDVQNLLTEIVKGDRYNHPKAIGVDVDFSPDYQGWRDEDLEFFEFCMAKRDEVPIYLAVHRTIGLPAKNWVGLSEFAPLAGGVFADSSDTTRLPEWFAQPNKEEEKLPSLAAALAHAYRKEGLPRPSFWRALFVDSGHEKSIAVDDGGSKPIVISERLINYSKLELLRQTTIPVKSAEGVAQIRELLNGKVVILGRDRNAIDKFPVPGRDGSVPGVFLHASAAYTFIKEPLFELKLGVRLLIDFLLSLLIIWLVARIRFRERGVSATEWHRRQKKTTYTLCFLIIVVGFVLAQFAFVLWLDFVPLIFALLLHPHAEKKLESWLETSSTAAVPELKVTS